MRRIVERRGKNGKGDGSLKGIISHDDDVTPFHACHGSVTRLSPFRERVVFVKERNDTPSRRSSPLFSSIKREVTTSSDLMRLRSAGRQFVRVLY